MQGSGRSNEVDAATSRVRPTSCRGFRRPEAQFLERLGWAEMRRSLAVLSRWVVPIANRKRTGADTIASSRVKERGGKEAVRNRLFARSVGWPRSRSGAGRADHGDHQKGGHSQGAGQVLHEVHCRRRCQAQEQLRIARPRAHDVVEIEGVGGGVRILRRTRRSWAAGAFGLGVTGSAR